MDDQEVSDSIKKSSTRYLNIKIRLNDPYTDKAGKVYNNYGSYIMQKFYENPKDFRNLYKFLHDICPGFYFKITNGLGAMTRIEAVQLAMFYQEKVDNKPKTMVTHLTSTEEVLLTTNFDMNRTELEKLAKQPDRTYLKTLRDSSPSYNCLSTTSLRSTKTIPSTRQDLNYAASTAQLIQNTISTFRKMFSSSCR